MRVLVLAAAIVASLAAPARAATTVLHAQPSGPRSLPGIARAPAFDLDGSALARLRSAHTARLGEFPVGTGRATLDLERFDPFAAAHIDVVDVGGTRRLAPPDLAFFRGGVEGDPGSLAVVTAGPSSLRALVFAAGGVTVVGPDADGTHRAWRLADVDPTRWAPPAAFCMNDLADLATPKALAALGTVTAPATAATHLGPRRAEVAIETDQELRAKFGSDEEALDYVASLVAAVSAIYERDVEIALDVSYLRLWNSTDPWSASAPDGQLDELRSHWNDPANAMATIAGPRDVVHMLSGKPVLGGIAYVDAVCMASWAYGVSQVYGAFDVGTPWNIWDLVVVAHELGHGFGTEHTHCYSPPIDTCFSGEPGCYVGPETIGPGTIMSYCHLGAGGLGNIDLRFDDRVRDLLHATTASQSCLAPDVESPCGNGTLDEGEECDDGNRTVGDGCSGRCRIEACGNGTLDLGEECDDGNTLGGDGCSAACEQETCGDGVLTGGEECDDGNTVSGDGCAPTCRVERCALFLPHQTVWSASRLLVKPGNARTLTLRAGFEIPGDAVVDATAAGLTILGETAGGGTGLSITLPGGARWSVRGPRMRYRDPGAAADGVKKAILTVKSRGERARVKLVVIGRDGPYPETLDAMPARLTIVLGGETAGASGACGEWAPTVGSCRVERGGKRLACR